MERKAVVGGRWARTPFAFLGTLASFLAGCSTTIVGGAPSGDPGASAGTTSASATGGSGALGGSANGAGGSSSVNGGASGGQSTAGSSASSGGTGSSGSVGSGGGSGASATPPTQCADQSAVMPGRAPLRRLTKVEYNNTVRDLLGDTTQPAYALPTELSGNGFGNDADQQPVPEVLAEGYESLAADIASRMTASPTLLGALDACASNPTSASESSCARTIIQKFVPKAYRRPLATGEADDYAALYQSVRANDTFASAIAAVIEAVLQSPDFLYRVEFGVADAANPSLKRPTGYEMATRLSYFFWKTMPDAQLTAAAERGDLGTSSGVRAQAERLVADAKTRDTVRFFFEGLLPLTGVTDEARDPLQYPSFSSAIGALMLTETRTYLDYEVFDGPGTWSGILTEPYTFVNQTLATYYGISGVTGDSFQKVPVDTTQRLGLLTQGAIMTGTTVTNFTNPVRRGAFILNQLMCRNLQVPIGLMVTPPDPYSAATARERYSLHSKNSACAGCHQQLDPMGFPFENYDAVGLYRTTENGETIDASGAVPDMDDGEVSGPLELIQKLAQNDEVQACFASKWLDFGYGQTLNGGSPDDVCTREALAAKFREGGFNVKNLLVELTQTDGFLYLGAQE
jgi:hypothetical protein